MPGVAGRVVGRGGEGAVGPAPPPVGLSLEVPAVARGAVFGVHGGAEGDQLEVRGVRAERAVAPGRVPEVRAGPPPWPERRRRLRT